MKPRTQEEQNKLYMQTWDYDPTEEEVDALYDDDFDERIEKMLDGRLE